MYRPTFQEGLLTCCFQGKKIGGKIGVANSTGGGKTAHRENDCAGDCVRYSQGERKRKLISSPRRVLCVKLGAHREKERGWGRDERFDVHIHTYVCVCACVAWSRLMHQEARITGSAYRGEKCASASQQSPMHATPPMGDDEGG